MSPLAHLDALERLLVAKGFPAMTTWWRSTFEAFFRSKKRQLVLRVGRRGGKSSSLCRIAVLLALYGEWTITPGDVGIIGFVSVSRDEAAQRLRMIKAILDAIGVAYKPIEGGIELASRPIVFKVFAATISGVVGGSWLALFGDELARWRDADSGANPATQVLESARPALAGQPNALLFLSSSALGTLDAHAKAVEAGDTPFQMVAIATTWEARPSLTEAMTRELEPSERVWLREYACVPSGDSTSVLRPEWVTRAQLPRETNIRLASEHERVLALDWSRGADDRAIAIARWVAEEREIALVEYAPNPATGFAWSLHVAPRIVSGAWNEEEGRFEREVHRQDAGGHWGPCADHVDATRARQVLDVEFVDALPSELDTEAAVMAVGRIARRPRPRGDTFERVSRVVADQYEIGALSVLLRQQGLRRPDEQTWSATTKTRAVDRMERLFRDGLIRIPAGERVRRQLLEYSEKITRTGIKYEGRGKKDDLAAVIVTLCMASVAGELPGDVTSIDRRRHEYNPAA